MTMLSRCARIADDGYVEIRLGKVELGQGILTALGQLAADELDVSMARIRILAAHTEHGPNEGLTAGSLSVATSGPALRRVCANVRALFVAEAASRWGVDAADVSVVDGRIEAGTRSTSYAELASSVDLNVAADPNVPLRTVRRIAGTSVPRLDLPDKIAGRPRFLPDLELPGLLHGRVVRPPSPGGQLLSTVDVEGLVRDGSFLGVVGENEAAVVAAAERVRAGSTWSEPAALPDENDLITFLRKGPHETIEVLSEPMPDERAVRPAEEPPELQPTDEHRQSTADRHTPDEQTAHPIERTVQSPGGPPDFHSTGEHRQSTADRHSSDERIPQPVERIVYPDERITHAIERTVHRDEQTVHLGEQIVRSDKRTVHPIERTVQSPRGSPDFHSTDEHRQSAASRHSPDERIARSDERTVHPDERNAHSSEQSVHPDVQTVHPIERTVQSPGGSPDFHSTGEDRQFLERQVSARYSKPYLAHASIAPSCGVARWDEDGRVNVWSHSQGIHRLRDGIAQALGLESASVIVQHVEHAGSYGHNGADDAAFDAVLLSKAVPGRPVRVSWTRRDELTWSPVGSAMVADVSATVDSMGCIRSWIYDVWSQGHTARPGHSGVPGLLAYDNGGPSASDPPLKAGGGIVRNAVPCYEVGARRITGHRLLESPIRTSSLRSLGAFMNVFAIESFMDELAGDRDPLAFRLEHLTDGRARRVLEAAAGAVGWPVPAAGIGFAQYKGNGAYCAVIAEVEAEHDIRVRKLTIAADVGFAVNPDGVCNQLEGGAVQATSWTLKERFTRGSEDWESYPILRFSEVPDVRVELVDANADRPSLGAGEAAQGPTAGAIANAVAAAVGVRVRDLPVTREAVIAAIEQGGNDAAY